MSFKKSIWTDEHPAISPKGKSAGPCGIVVDKNGILYYTQQGSHTLFQVDRTGKTSRYHFADAKAKLAGLVYDGNYMLYICDTTGRVVRFDTSTKKFHIIGRKPKGFQEDDGPLGTARFYSPRGIDIDKNGNLYLTDGNRVRKISIREGVVETIAGQEKAGYLDGPTSSARFSKPHGISIKEDEIVVADNSNNCVRRIKNGLVSTIAGTPKKSFVDSPIAVAWNFDGKLLVVERYYLKAVDGCFVIPLPRKYSFGLSTIQSDNRGNLFIGADTIGHLQETWKWERFLWVGKLKEDCSYCLLTHLPMELIKHIAGFTKCLCPQWLMSTNRHQVSSDEEVY